MVGVGIGVDVGGGKVGRFVGMGICVIEGTGVFVGKPDEVMQHTMLCNKPQFPPIVQT